MKTFKELFERLKLFYRLEAALCDELEQLNNRLDLLESTCKSHTAEIKAIQESVGRLTLSQRIVK